MTTRTNSRELRGLGIKGILCLYGDNGKENGNCYHWLYKVQDLRFKVLVSSHELVPQLTANHNFPSPVDTCHLLP